MQRRSFLAFLAMGCFSAVAVSAQMDMPAAGKKPLSPPEVAMATIGKAVVTIHYASPSRRGRRIMGELVPYGKVWRTGANAATTLTTTGNLRIGGLRVKAGTYTLYTLPAEKGWTLIVNKQTGQWGTIYDEKQDLGRVPMMAAKVPVHDLENFILVIEPKGSSRGELHLRWEDTDVFVPVTAQ